MSAEKGRAGKKKKGEDEQEAKVPAGASCTTLNNHASSGGSESSVHATRISSSSMSTATSNVVTAMMATRENHDSDFTTTRPPQSHQEGSYQRRGTANCESAAALQKNSLSRISEDESKQVTRISSRTKGLTGRNKQVEETRLVWDTAKKKRRKTTEIIEDKDSTALNTSSAPKYYHLSANNNNACDSAIQGSQGDGETRIHSDHVSYRGINITRSSAFPENRRSSPLSVAMSSSTSRSVRSQSPPSFLPQHERNTISREANPVGGLDNLTTTISSHDDILLRYYLASRAATELPTGTSQQGRPVIGQVPQGVMPHFLQSPSLRQPVEPHTSQASLLNLLGLQQQQTPEHQQEALLRFFQQQQSPPFASLPKDDLALNAMKLLGTDEETRRTMMLDILLQQQLSMRPPTSSFHLGDPTTFEAGRHDRQQQYQSEALSQLLFGGLLQSTRRDTYSQQLQQQSHHHQGDDHVVGVTRGNNFLPSLPLQSNATISSSAPNLDTSTASQPSLTNTILQLLASQDMRLNTQRGSSPVPAGLSSRDQHQEDYMIPPTQLQDILLAAIRRGHSTSLPEQPLSTDFLYRASPTPATSASSKITSAERHGDTVPRGNSNPLDTLHDGIEFLASQIGNQRAATGSSSTQVAKIVRQEKPFALLEMKLGDDGFPLDLPCALALPDDHVWLSPHQVFLRQQIEVFRATKQDISTHKRGRNKPIVVGQVGIRCRHCAHLPLSQGQRGSTYFPATLHGIYQASQNMNSTHLQCGLCLEMPESVRQQFSFLVSTRLKSSGAGRPHWELAAKRIGLLDSPTGICFIRDVQQEARTKSIHQGVNQQQEPSSDAVRSIKPPKSKPNHPSDHSGPLETNSAGSTGANPTDDTSQDPST